MKEVIKIPKPHNFEQFDVEQLIRLIGDNFKESEIEFVGWGKQNTDAKIISIDGINYKIKYAGYFVMLQKFTSQIEVPKRKMKYLDKYNDLISKIKGSQKTKSREVNNETKTNLSTRAND